MTVDLAVLGLGYVGLPLAREACRAGMSVIGYDVSSSVVELLNAGRSHVDDVAAEDLIKMLEAGFSATTDQTLLADAKAIVMCVPTPLSDDGLPDLSAVRAATTTVAEVLQPGTLVILESTTYPGTTDELVVPILETSGLTAGTDFYVAYSPERIDPGNMAYGVHNTPKVVGGYTPACTERAADFYQRFVKSVIRTKGTREAETAKLLENTYRHINIALVNEMARFCHELGIDLWDVIRAASSKPFGYQPFYPGPGVGGHCIPIDPNYLSHNVRARLGYPFRFVELAQEINSTMPAYVAHRVQNLLNQEGMATKGASILLLGITYKPNVSDQRESPAVPLARQLRALGASVMFHDPYVEHWDLNGTKLTCVTDLEDAVAKADLTILVQNHQQYDADKLAEKARLFFDTRGVTTGDRSHRL